MPRPLPSEHVWVNRWALRPLFVMWLSLLAGFTLFRVVFYFMYRGGLANVPTETVVMAFLNGLRFDASAVFTLTGLPALAFVLLSPLSMRKVVFWLLFAVTAVAAIFMFVTLGVDLFYYDVVGRRVSFEALDMLNDWQPVAAMIGGGHPVATTSILGVLGVALLLAARSAARLVSRPWEPLRRRNQVLHGVLLLLLVVFMGRGGWQSKPLAVGMAFNSPHMAAGHLTLNPVFTVIRNIYRRGNTLWRFYPDAEALATTRSLMGLPAESPDPRYPMLQTVLQTALQTTPGAPRGSGTPSGRRPSGAPRSSGPRNLVIITMESLSAQFLGALGDKRGLTPNLDRLAKEGLLFSNFYATGTRSIEGIASILTGFPALPHATLIGSSLEQSKMQSLPLVLREAGYNMLFLHGAFRGSMWFDTFASRHGFQRYVAKDNFKNAKQESDSYWGIFDHYSLQRFHEELEATPRPMLGFYFSLSNHTPFDLPDESFRTFPADTPDADRMNSVAYSDYALGRFFELARTSSYWEHTVFMVTADHNMGQVKYSAQERMRIPLLILVPGDPNFPRGQISDVLGGQVDMAPTALELLGVPAQHSFAGRSLLQPGGRRYAQFGWGNQAGWLNEQSLVIHDTQRPLAFYRWREDPELQHNLLGQGGAAEATAVREIQSYLQTWNNLLLNNRLYPPQ